ncbi:hypothetical protein D3C87_1295730 [compost metagenome]
MPVVSVPRLLPGASVAPLAMVTWPAMLPPPLSVAPFLTCTVLVPVALPVVLFTRSVPALTSVAPV